MGLNYYHVYDVCPHCGRRMRQHLGKSSVGWAFLFQGSKHIRTYKDWLRILEAGGRIETELGRQVSLEQFKAIVEAKQDGRTAHRLDDEGHPFIDGEFS